MKLLIGTIVLATGASLAPAQTHVIQADGARAAGEFMRKIGPVRNMPFTADEVNESVQTLADGNRIVRNTTGKMYRNSEGHTRRDRSGGMGGLLGSTYSFGQTMTFNSGVGQSYLLEAPPRPPMLPSLPAVPPATLFAPDALPPQAVEEMAKAGVEMSKAGAEMARAAVNLQNELKVMAQTAPLVASTYAEKAGQGGVITGVKSKYETRTEELGTRDFEGVSADGTRRVTTIPAGAIGNDRAIEIVYERWFSKELGVVVHSKNTDPRSGEQTYRLTNIVRAEPDPSLFVRPTKVSRTPTTTRATPVKATAERPVQTGGVSRARP